jgi:hypothetical protein
MPQWSQTDFFKYKSGPATLIAACVDDLIMAGPGQDLLWSQHRKEVLCAPPAVISIVLCVHVAFPTAGHVVFSMRCYLASFLEMFRAAGCFLSQRVRRSPHRDIPSSWFNGEAWACPGQFNGRAAPPLMKLMYGARCALLFCVAFLAREITRWTRISDLRLRSMFQYVRNALDVDLHATCDISSSLFPALKCFCDADLAGSDDTTCSTRGGW